MSFVIVPSPRPSADFPALGFDPAPGEVWEVNSLARTLSNGATTLQQIDDVLQGTGRGAWRGEAAEAFRDLMADDLRPKIRAARNAFSDAQRTIANWAEDLAEFQSRARDLERRAQSALDQVGAAERTVDGLPRPPLTPPFTLDEDERRERERARETRDAAEDALDAARELLASIRRLAEALWEEYYERARSRADELKDSADAAPDEPGLFDRALDALGDLVKFHLEVLSAIGDFVMDALEFLAPALRVLADVAGFAAAVLGLLSLIPGLQFLAPFALGFAALAMVSDYLAAVGETGSLVEAFKDPQFIMGAVSVVLGGGSMALGRVLVSAAPAASSTVPQLIGPAIRVPPGFFSSIATGAPNLSNAAAFTVGVKGAYDFYSNLGNIYTVGNTVGLIPSIPGTS